MLLNHSGFYLALHISFELWQELFCVTNLISTQWIILISCSGHLYMPRNEQIGSRFNRFPCFCCYFFSSLSVIVAKQSQSEREKQLPRWKGPLCPSVAQQAACFFFFVGQRDGEGPVRNYESWALYWKVWVRALKEVTAALTGCTITPGRGDLNVNRLHNVVIYMWRPC